MKQLSFETKNVYIVGDVHGEFEIFSKVIKRRSKEPSIFLCCGDFCFWEKASPIKKLVVPENVLVFSCPGNHEDWATLESYGYNITQVAPRVFYMPFGSILKITTPKVSKTFMFCGGALSIDKALRTPYVTWWPNEVISPMDMGQLDLTCRPDVIISHTAPNLMVMCKDGPRYEDVSRDYLGKIAYIYEPKEWFFGHFHKKMKGKDLGLKWMCLGESKQPTSSWVHKYI